MFKTLLWWTITCLGAYLYSAGTQYGNLLKLFVLGTNNQTGYWLVCPFLGSCPVATPQRLNCYTGWLCYGKTWPDWHRLVRPFLGSCPVDTPQRLNCSTGGPCYGGKWPLWTHHKDWTAPQEDCFGVMGGGGGHDHTQAVTTLKAQDTAA